MSDADVTPSPMLARTAARLAAIQALYQMETGGGGVDATVREFRAHRLGTELDGDAIVEADAPFFEDILRGVVELQPKIDPYIAKRLSQGWTLQRIDSTARAILRCGLFELVRRADVPARAIIDEYVELAHDFFDGDEPGFINGVLDAAAKDVRASELT